MRSDGRSRGDKSGQLARAAARGRGALTKAVQATRGPEEGDRFRRMVAFAMVAVSLFGAFVSYRASKASERAGGLDQQANQEELAVQQQQINTELTVSDDLRLLGHLEEQLRNQRILYSDAQEIRRHDPSLGRHLESEYSQARREAVTLSRFFLLTPFIDLQTGRVLYDPVFARDAAKGRDIRFQVLRPAITREAGRQEHQRSVEYTRAAALLVGALFFLTLAQLIDNPRRRLLAAVGGVVSIGAVVQFLVAL